MNEAIYAAAYDATADALDELIYKEIANEFLVEEARIPIKKSEYDESKFVHSKHIQDGFPTCWGIDRIVKWKRDKAEQSVVLVTKAFKDVTCPYCINIRNGGHGRFYRHSPSTRSKTKKVT